MINHFYVFCYEQYNEYSNDILGLWIVSMKSDNTFD